VGYAREQSILGLRRTVHPVCSCKQTSHITSKAISIQDMIKSTDVFDSRRRGVEVRSGGRGLAPRLSAPSQDSPCIA
jgi:hypothetical protein